MYGGVTERGAKLRTGWTGYSAGGREEEEQEQADVLRRYHLEYFMFLSDRLVVIKRRAYKAILDRDQ